MSDLPDWVCDECGMTFRWGEMHAHVEDDTSNLSKLSEFLVDVEDMAKERGVSAFVGIPDKIDENFWSVVCRFEVGRPESPPDLGVSVSDGLGIKDEMK